MARKQVQPQRPLRSRPSRSANGRSAKAAANAGSALCVVGIGASAGGFDALVEFLRVVPANSGLAFIVLQHLSPSPRSLSAELFSRHTEMKVRAARDGMRLEANYVYTTPADRDIRVLDGTIRLSTPREAPGHRLPIDRLFSSLGLDRRVRAIGIILSGTGSDGSAGLKDIVANGGIALVQAPETAQFDGMPRSAIATGLIAHVLPIAQMPRVLIDYARHPKARDTPPPTRTSTEVDDSVDQILTLLQVSHRQSFVGYKQAMLRRRIERRMGLLNIEALNDYVKHLRRDATEVAALRKDLLIGVTEFFRDRKAWEALDTEVLRPLIADKKPGEPIRAWVAGTGTGEEAYTLAILLLARLRRMKRRCVVQIFGTDANRESVSVARAGRYPLGIRAQVPAETLKRYFQEIRGDDCYQVTAEVRESVIFGDHDLLADPPYSRLDLVTCRNLLIYIEPEMQERILLLCHFALRPNGYLFLGSAETAAAHETLFRNVAKRWHIYQRIGTTPRDRIDWRIDSERRQARPLARPPLSDASRVALHANQTRNALFERFAPAAVLVNGQLEPLYCSGAVDRLLSPARGTHKNSFLARLRKDLRIQLPAAIHRAQLAQRPVVIRGATAKKAGQATLQLEVLPIRHSPGDPTGPRYLIAFEELHRQKPATKSRMERNQLQQELRAELARVFQTGR